MKRGEIVFSVLVLAGVVGLTIALGQQAKRKRGQEMFSEGIVIGVVLKIDVAEEPKRPDVLLVEDRSRPEWPQQIACEFFNKQKHLLQTVQPGDLVRVVGGIKSSESRSGGYFTHYVGFALQSLSAYMQSREGEIRKQHTERRGDGNDLPF